MKRYFRRKYFSYVRSKALLKATLVKHIYSMSGAVLGILWVVFYGIDLFVAAHSQPSVNLDIYIKPVTIFFGYATVMVNFHYDYKK